MFNPFYSRSPWILICRRADQDALGYSVWSSGTMPAAGPGRTKGVNESKAFQLFLKGSDVLKEIESSISVLAIS